MTRDGLTTRDIGRAVGLDHSAVARWLKGTKPYRASVAKLSEFFKVPAEVLIDDSRDLPIDPAVAEIQARYSAAAEEVAKIPADQQNARQAVFEKSVERGQHQRTLKETAKRLRDLADELDPPATISAEQMLQEMKARVKAGVIIHPQGSGKTGGAARIRGELKSQHG